MLVLDNERARNHNPVPKIEGELLELLHKGMGVEATEPVSKEKIAEEIRLLILLVMQKAKALFKHIGHLKMRHRNKILHRNPIDLEASQSKRIKADLSCVSVDCGGIKCARPKFDLQMAILCFLHPRVKGKYFCINFTSHSRVFFSEDFAAFFVCLGMPSICSLLGFLLPTRIRRFIQQAKMPLGENNDFANKKNRNSM